MKKNKMLMVDPSRNYNITLSCDTTDMETIRLMHKNNYQYYQNFTTLRWIKFYFYILIGKIYYVQLPSEHPYWRQVVRRDTEKSLKVDMSKYKECLEDWDKIKYHYNRETSLKDIREKIRRVEDQIESSKSPSKIVNVLHDIFYYLDIKYKIGS